MNDRIKELIKKVAALAKDGVGGEKINAQAQLEKLMKKYNITDQDIEENRLEWHEVHANKIYFGVKLLNQCIYVVLGKEIYNKTSKAGSYAVYVLCTLEEKLLIEMMYEHYVKHWTQYVADAYQAFLQVNEVFPPRNIALEPTGESDPEDLERMFKIARSMDQHKFKKDEGDYTEGPLLGVSGYYLGEEDD